MDLIDDTFAFTGKLEAILIIAFYVVNIASSFG